MSLFDEIKQEASKHNTLDEKRAQIEALRDQAKAAFNAQFLMGSENEQQAAFLKGRLAALDECLQLFMTEEEEEQKQGSRKWDDDDM